MSGMFINCISLTSLIISNFNTSNVVFMNSMFRNCISLKNLNLNNFVGTKIEFIESMFENCENLTSLDLPNFDANPKNMFSLFKNSYSIECINIPKIKTDFITNALSIFENCYSLR